MIRPVLVAVLLMAAPAAADEFRMVDGEIVFGEVIETKKGRVHVKTADGLKRLREAWIQERIEGVAPAVVIAEREAKLAKDDADGLADLAMYAWRHFQDEAAVRLANASIADPAEADPRALRILGALEATSVVARKRTWTQPLPRWGTRKRQARAKGGGTAATEAAVSAALKWLAVHQDSDGKLDADGFPKHDPEGDKTDGKGGGHHGGPVPCPFDGVTTSVALMAWLASGSTPVSGPYRDNVKRALDWCARQLSGGLAGSYGMWNYGFCAQAVADAVMVTRDPKLLEDLHEATRRILSTQLDDGGWSYYMRIGDAPTTAVAGSALGLAMQAGIPLPSDRVNRLKGFLNARIDPKTGRSEYHDGAEKKRYTPTRANAASGLSVRALLGMLRITPHLGKSVATINDRKPVWSIKFKEVKAKDGRVVKAQIGNLYPYRWYYTTMALYEHGGASWSKWFGGLKKALLKGQRKDGAAAGSWDPLGTYSNSAGRVFITGLCTLMLQTPYRYPRSR